MLSASEQLAAQPDSLGSAEVLHAESASALLALDGEPVALGVGLGEEASLDGPVASAGYTADTDGLLSAAKLYSVS